MCETRPKPKVLFLCTGNSCRSQMAEGFLRHVAGDRFEAHSAGLEPKPVHPLAVEVMAEAGVDIAAQKSKDAREYLSRVSVEHAIIVCANAEKRCPTTFPFALYRHYWPFEDPAAFEGSEDGKRAKFREVRDQIATKIQNWVSELEAHGASESER